MLGILFGTLRTVPQRGLVYLGNAWVELFRNIPLLVQMFLWFFVFPELLNILKCNYAGRFGFFELACGKKTLLGIVPFGFNHFFPDSVN